MKKILITTLLILIILGSGYFIYLKDLIKLNFDNKEVAPVAQIETKSNVGVYFSKLLGVKFQYALVDPMYPPAGEIDYYGNITPQPPKNTVIENGNEITTTGGGVVKVFFKDPKISLEDEIKNKFNASNCKIIVEKNSDYLGIQARIFYPDLSNGRGGTEAKWADVLGDFVLSEKDKKCIKENTYTPNYFAMTDEYPDRYIGVKFSTQSPEGVLYVTEDNNVVTWMSTLEFIPIN